MTQLRAALSVKEAAAYVSVSPSTMEKLIRTREVRSLKIRGRRLLRPEALDAYTLEQEQIATNEANARAQAVNGKSLVDELIQIAREHPLGGTP